MEHLEAYVYIAHRNHRWAIPTVLDVEFITTRRQTMNDPEEFDIVVNDLVCIGNHTDSRDYDLLGQLIRDNLEIHGSSIVELV